MGEREYLLAMQELLNHGNFREGRNGGVYSLFGRQIRYPLTHSFPLFTTKFVAFKAMVVELLWFLKGKTNVDYLHEHNVHIWDQWADENGDLGPVYGAQWRNWDGYSGLDSIDQITNVIKSIKEDPYGRRHVVSAWNPAEIEDMALPPCHCLFQFYVENGKLSCQLYQRSADWFIGVPFNVASYALLTMLIARECGLRVGELVHTVGDYHLYANHRVQALEQLNRSIDLGPMVFINAEPEIGIFDLEPHHIDLQNYHHKGVLKAPVSK